MEDRGWEGVKEVKGHGADDAEEVGDEEEMVVTLQSSEEDLLLREYEISQDFEGSSEGEM